MSREEKSLFAFLKEYKDEPNVPDYTGEYPPPYELTQDDAELILNVKEKQDKEIERLKLIIKAIKEQCDVMQDYEMNEYIRQKQIIEGLKKEIERLNNIINKLEKESYLGMLENQNNNEYAKGLYTAYKYINDKLQELKGEKQ